jgi:hypothetical protein
MYIFDNRYIKNGLNILFCLEYIFDYRYIKNGLNILSCLDSFSVKLGTNGQLLSVLDVKSLLKMVTCQNGDLH